MISQTTMLPVERLVSLHAATDGRVPYTQGSYNLSLARITIGWWGIFRNSTRNARHLLGWPAMAEGEYQSDLWFIRFDDEWNIRQLIPIQTPGTVIHDVRISPEGLIGCWRAKEGEFYPVSCILDRSMKLHYSQVDAAQGKNWNFLPGGWIDKGWVDGVGLVRAFRGSKGLADNIVAMDGPHLRGSAPCFKLGDRLLTTYHTVGMRDGQRDYWHYFAELEPAPPYPIRRLSPGFKLGRGGEAGRIQFLMSVLDYDAEHILVSYGEADCDNCIGLVKKADILGILI